MISKKVAEEEESVNTTDKIIMLVEVEIAKTEEIVETKEEVEIVEVKNKTFLMRMKKVNQFHSRSEVAGIEVDVEEKEVGVVDAVLEVVVRSLKEMSEVVTATITKERKLTPMMITRQKTHLPEMMLKMIIPKINQLAEVVEDEETQIVTIIKTLMIMKMIQSLRVLKEVVVVGVEATVVVEEEATGINMIIRTKL